jgi:F420-dependent oxidoreductase-like protein
MIVEVAQVASDGFAAFWAPQVLGFDALTMLALAARDAPGIELGTGVVTVQTRHPVVLASQALTVQAASAGRFTLGIGLSHKPAVEGIYGLAFSKPVRQLRETLKILTPLLAGSPAKQRGELVSANCTLTTSDLPAPSVLVAALGPQTLTVAGRLADGTMTWMTGARTLREHTIPTITAAAAEAGRPAPRIVVTLPVCVTDDVAGTRSRLAESLAFYNRLPSYRAMIEREGASGPADLAIVGDAAHLAAEIKKLHDIGITDFAAMEIGADDRERGLTRDALRELL